MPGWISGAKCVYLAHCKVVINGKGTGKKYPFGDIGSGSSCNKNKVPKLVKPRSAMVVGLAFFY